MKKISRKQFLAGGAVAAVAATGACLCTKTGWATITGVGNTPELDQAAYEIADDGSIEIRLDLAGELAKPGGSVKITADGLVDSLIIARTGDETYVAASIHCTHRGVEVEYRSENGCFKCASLGGSKFETNGKNRGGFANSPLKTYAVVREGERLLVRTS